MRTITITFCLLAVFAAPVTTQTPAPTSWTAQLTQAQRTAIEKELTEATNAIIADVNQRSTGALAKYLSSEFQERVVNGNIVTTGKDAYLKHITEVFSQRTSQKMETDLIKVNVISSDVAYVVWAGAASMVMKNGRHGGYGDAITRIWRKEPGGWKIIHHHESNW